MKEIFSPDQIINERKEKSEHVAKLLTGYINRELRDNYDEEKGEYSVGLTNVTPESRPMNNEHVDNDVLEVLKEKAEKFWNVDIEKNMARDGSYDIFLNLKPREDDSGAEDKALGMDDIISVKEMKEVSDREIETVNKLTGYIKKKIREDLESNISDKRVIVSLMGQNEINEKNITFKVIGEVQKNFQGYDIEDVKEYSGRGFDRYLEITKGDSDVANELDQSNKDEKGGDVFTPEMAMQLSRKEGVAVETLKDFINQELKNGFRDGVASIRWADSANLPVKSETANNMRVINALKDAYGEYWNIEEERGSDRTGTITKYLIFTPKEKAE